MGVLSTFRNASLLPLHQGGRKPKGPPADPSIHYVAFHFTDGDNVEWLDGEHPGSEFYSGGKFWDSKARGTVPVGWGIGPDQRDLGQPIAEHLYATASSAAGGEDFFIATEPVEYTYISKMSDEGRAVNAKRMNAYMRDLDLDLLNLVVYKDSFANCSKNFGPYLAQDSVSAVIGYNWDGGYENGDAIYWVPTPAGDTKPVITGRYALWVKDADQVTALLNQQVASIGSSAGYSVVPVSVWARPGVGQLKTIMDNLHPHVKVVSPQRLVELVIDNVKPKRDTAVLVV